MLIHLLNDYTLKNKKIRGLIFKKSPVFWGNLGNLSSALALLFPCKESPLLVIALPRSGTSWVGEIMSLSTNSLYLREPINQTFLASRGGRGPSIFEIKPNRVPPAYKSAADAAFAGLPIFPPLVTKHPRRWSLLDRKKKRVVIKEVNPLAINWITSIYKPKIIYLVRHPAAVANSFHRLGWTGKIFEIVFSSEKLASLGFDYRDFTHSFWVEFGAMQSIVLRFSLEALSNYPDHIIVKYEDLCSNPVMAYRELYDFASLEWDDGIEEQILAYSATRGIQKTGEYGVFRNSQIMVDKWKTELPERAVKEIKEAYMVFNPPFYGAEEW
jgi:hypothetical protein